MHAMGTTTDRTLSVLNSSLQTTKHQSTLISPRLGSVHSDLIVNLSPISNLILKTKKAPLCT
jgi:hypothetical protein